MKRLFNVVLALFRRRRRSANVKTTLIHRLVSAGLYSPVHNKHEIIPIHPMLHRRWAIVSAAGPTLSPAHARPVIPVILVPMTTSVIRPTSASVQKISNSATEIVIWWQYLEDNYVYQSINQSIIGMYLSLNIPITTAVTTAHESTLFVLIL